MRWWPLALLPLVACGATEEAPQLAEDTATDVVDDEGPFDPAEAVTDADDEAEVGNGTPGDEQTEGGEVGDVLDGAASDEVASPGTVEHRKRAFEEAGKGSKDEDRKKARLAKNPRPQPLPPRDPAFLTVADTVLDTLLVLAVAALLAGLWTWIATLRRRRTVESS